MLIGLDRGFVEALARKEKSKREKRAVKVFKELVEESEGASFAVTALAFMFAEPSPVLEKMKEAFLTLSIDTEAAEKAGRLLNKILDLSPLSALELSAFALAGATKIVVLRETSSSFVRAADFLGLKLTYA